MKNTKIIILSTLTTLVLLINGCGGGSSSSIGDVGTENPLIPDSPVVITSDPLVPEPTDPSLTEPTLPVDPYKPAGWYGKTKVSLTTSTGKVFDHISAGVFGELKQSEEGKDLHDLKGYGAATFQIVFPQTEWEDDNGDYFSNYQAFTEDSVEKKVWTFQLKAFTESDFAISIELDGLYDVSYLEKDGRVLYKDEKSKDNTRLESLQLVDVDHGIIYTYAQLQSLSLKMDGLRTRTFRWVLGTVDTSDLTITAKKASPQTASFKSVTTEDETEVFTWTPQLTGKRLPPQ